MRVTKRLLDYLHSVFDKSPGSVLALRLGYNAPMTWTVRDAVLTTSVVGGTGRNLTIDLRQYNLQQLATFLASQPGYEVRFLNQDLLATGARALLDQSNSIDTSNGDHISAHTNVLWSFLEAMAVELDEARLQVVQMLRQMSTRTAEDVWLDELGSYYGVPRFGGEVDALYGPRIISEVLRPRGNNIAIALAIQAFTGQESEVLDVFEYGVNFPLHDGSISHTADFTYNSTATRRFGLFDVTYGYDLLNGGNYQQFEAAIRALLNRLRDAGTHMRALVLRAGVIDDTGPPAEDGALESTVQPQLVDVGPSADDTLVVPSLAMSLEELNVAGGFFEASAADYYFDHFYNDVRVHDARFNHQGGVVFTGGSLESEFDGIPIFALAELNTLVNVTLPSASYL